MLFVIIATFVVLGASARPQVQGDREGDIPDIYMDTYELIAHYGYPVEKHKVKTEDGYLLTMHRIPHGKDQDPSAGRPVVFLQHGLFCSSSDWVIMGPGKGFDWWTCDYGRNDF